MRSTSHLKYASGILNLERRVRLCSKLAADVFVPIIIGLYFKSINIRTTYDAKLQVTRVENVCVVYVTIHFDTSISSACVTRVQWGFETTDRTWIHYTATLITIDHQISPSYTELSHSPHTLLNIAATKHTVRRLRWAFKAIAPVQV
jgi:hypothetical protein